MQRAIAPTHTKEIQRPASRRIRKTSLTALVAGVALLVAAAPAVAAAEHFRFEGCENEDDGVQLCGSSHFVVNRTETPNGITTYASNLKYDLTFTFPGGESFSATGSGRYHEVYKQGEPQEFHTRFQEVYTNPATGTCYLEVSYHYANGEFQFEGTEMSGECP